ncbi:cupin domain-containing protein [Streptomyces reniochalinae]|uniref:Cupin domain-containing protein n=1 Tax=Streptomyces reniochalinae TaxID=2250578 RepID=A0A367EFI2_9ACTN|nr:cupin domain-containing protein [Streptomyces reniochalinae]RCG15980.1 cupin domain-containing protein [Streptomyces reniochalinae]
MSLIVPEFDDTVVVRAAEAEVLGQAPSTVALLADADQTGGALSTQRVTLFDGANGATPHRHTRSAEMFYVLDGTAQLLSGDQVVTAERGDLVVVPPHTAHAFAAAHGRNADLLIVLAPGVARFGYFRHLARVAKGELPPESLLEVQDRYDNHFLHSAAWDSARS